jgi:hypothetical protein
LQPLPPPSSPHLRNGSLVRLHGLSARALNGRQALVFGPEQNGRVAARLVEASAEVRASLGWGRGEEKAIIAEYLLAFDAEGIQLCSQNAVLVSPPGSFSSARLALGSVLAACAPLNHWFCASHTLHCSVGVVIATLAIAVRYFYKK